jgi:hypothetical protein
MNYIYLESSKYHNSGFKLGKCERWKTVREREKSTINCFMYQHAETNRFYNTLNFITQRLKSVSRAEHELLNVEF